jgi:hypothetical protein
MLQTAASGTATEGNPGTTGLGTILQGFLETSNVEPVRELVDLIKTQGRQLRALLVGAGHNLRLILTWFRLFVAWFIAALISSSAPPNTSQVA